MANIDADDKKNKDLAMKYGVSGFPTLKFFSRDNKDEPETYDGGRSEAELISFLNSKCGTHRAVGGGLTDQVRVILMFFKRGGHRADAVRTLLFRLGVLPNSTRWPASFSLPPEKREIRSTRKRSVLRPAPASHRNTTFA